MIARLHIRQGVDMKIKRGLKIIEIIILIIIVLILVHTIRNTIIIIDLQNKVKKYSNSNNYHIKATTHINENTTMIINQYQKNEKQLLILERIVNDEKVKISYYNTGKQIDMFTETKDEKIAKLGKVNEILGMNSITPLQTDNLWQTILYSLPTKIKNVKVNDNECYSINDFLSPYNLLGKNKNEYDIEKETGLVRQIVLDEQITTREYDFENVDDSVFVEPDISQYTLKENN